MCEGVGVEAADGLNQPQEQPRVTNRHPGERWDPAPSKPAGLETLLLLHNEIYDQGNGVWIKIEAWSVEATEHVPHGIRYALTLHYRHGTRLLGLGNAHAVKPPKRRHCAGWRLAYDHRHRHARDKGVPYEFTSPQQLPEDFFNEVERVLEEATS